MTVSNRTNKQSASGIFRDFPFQIALRALDTGDQAERNRGIDAYIRGHRLSAAPKGTPIRIDGDWWRLYSFAKEEDAMKFRDAFGGRRFEKPQRPRSETVQKELWVKPLRS